MSKLIQCKTCNEEIAAGAKVCPKCGAKNKKPFYKKWWVWVIAVIVVAAIAGGGSDEGKKDTNTSGTSSSASKGETTYAIGDVLTTDKFEIKVTKVETADSVGSQYFNTTPSDGGVYVIVEWECKNISKKPVSAFSCPTISLVDSEDTSYDSDLDATTTYATAAELDSKVLSDLNPGINVKDAQVFEISKEAYDAGGFSVKVNADNDFIININ